MGKTSRVFILLLLIATVSRNVWANDNTRLCTVNLKEDNGRQVDGGSEGNVKITCIYDQYRFEIDQHGQMFFQEASTCLGSNGKKLGSMSEKQPVCQLDANLHCDSTMGRFPNVSFTASEQGLLASNSTIPWKETQQAAQLLPTIRAGAERNTKFLAGAMQNLCWMVFGRYVVELKRNGHIASDNTTSTNLKTCAQKFQEICSNPKSVAQMVSLAKESKDNSDINSSDIDNFCKTVQPNR